MNVSLLVELINLNWKYSREPIKFPGGHWRFCVNFTTELHYIQFADVELRFFEPLFLSLWISLSSLRGINTKMTRDILGVVVFVFCMMWMCRCWLSPLFPAKSIFESSLNLLAGIDVTASLPKLLSEIYYSLQKQCRESLNQILLLLKSQFPH